MAQLSGVRVLDFTQNLPGPYATVLLASLGADVIKVEPPKGDPARFLGPFFHAVNRGKRSVVLDLRDPASQSHLQALVRWADVLVEGFRPGVMARLGADAVTCRDWNPGLVYCSISAFGQSGPRQQQPGHDLNLQALTGLCHLERDVAGNPNPSLLPIADLSTSLAAVASICASLLARERGAGGQTLDLAMADTLLSWTDLWGRGVDLTRPLRGKIPPRLRAALDRRKLYVMPHYGLFRVRDGWLAVGVVDEMKFWRSLCEVLGLKPLAGLSMPSRTALAPVLRPLLAARLLPRSRAHWLARFEAAGLPITPVHDLDAARSDPQFVARGCFDATGQARSPLPGAQELPERGPMLGAHTAEVLDSLG